LAIALPTRRLCGFTVTPVTLDAMLGLMAEAISGRNRLVIASQNLHGLYIHARDPLFRALHEDPSTCVHIDGMPIIWLARMAGWRLHGGHRTTWVDIFPPMMERAAERGWRVFYLGGRQEVLDAGLERLRRQHPTLAVDGRNGFFSAAEEEAVAGEINAFGPDLLITGMGMGRQEPWIMRNRDRLRVPVIATSGACIEYYAEAVRTPPRWMGRAGLEWAFRLAEDPARFWRRYLVEPWAVAGYLARNAIRERRAAASEPPAPAE